MLTSPSQHPQQRQVPDLSLSTKITCAVCNGDTFSDAVKLRKFSALITDDGRDAIVPVQVLLCIMCGTVLPDTNPLSAVEAQEERQAKEKELAETNPSSPPIPILHT